MPVRSITPMGTIMVLVCECSRMIITQPHWDSILALPTRRVEAPGSTATNNSQPETETEDDGDVDVDRDRADTSPERAGNPPQISPHTSHAVGIITDSPPTTTGVSLEVNADAHIIINNGPTHDLSEVGVEDSIVSLESNDDFAMDVPLVPQALSRVPHLQCADRHRDETAAGSTRRDSQGHHHGFTSINAGHDCPSGYSGSSSASEQHPKSLPGSTHLGPPTDKASDVRKRHPFPVLQRDQIHLPLLHLHSGLCEWLRFYTGRGQSRLVPGEFEPSTLIQLYCGTLRPEHVSLPIGCRAGLSSRNPTFD